MLKICGIQDQAAQLSGLEPDYLGFIFYPKSPRHFQGSIKGLIPEVKRVGVFVNEQPEIILELLEKHNLDVIQLHGEESVQQCELLAGKAEVWKVFGVDSDFDFQRLSPYLSTVDKFLFDTKSEARGGTGISFDWEKLQEYPYNKPFILSGGIGPEHADEIKELKQSLPQMQGIDINSRFEIEPGQKDIELIKRFIDELSR